MNTPANGFKQALVERRVQIGLWLGLADPYCAEICAGAGFDWLALDAEHGPNTIRTLLAQLQALSGYPVHAVIRAASGDPTHLKQLLDIGAQTLIVPLVESAEHARAVVRATRSLSAAGRSSATLPDRHGRSGASSDGATTTPT